MISTRKALLIGASRAKGKLDDGTPYDSCKLFEQKLLDPTNGNAFGCTAVELRYGTSENFEQFRGHKFPLLVEIDYLDVATTKGQSRTVIQAVRPVKDQQQVKAA